MSSLHFLPSIFKFSCPLAYNTPSFLQVVRKYFLVSVHVYLLSVRAFSFLWQTLFSLWVFSASTISFLKWHNQTYKQDSGCEYTMELATKAPGPSLPFDIYQDLYFIPKFQQVKIFAYWSKPSHQGKAVG